MQPSDGRLLGQPPTGRLQRPLGLKYRGVWKLIS
jgi:hypothetical protein